MLTTGFNAPAVDLIAMLRPTLSPGLYVQIVGRGSRKADGKENCLLLDFGGNVARHGPVDTVTGAVRPERVQADGGGGNGLKVCPDCRSFVRTGTPTCPDCGHEWPVRAPKHNVVASSLSPLSGAGTRLPVRAYDCGLHYKPGRPPSLRVDFITGEALVSDWLPFGHGDNARFYAARKWRALGGRDPIPRDAAEALRRRHELQPVSAIDVERDGGFWRVRTIRVAS